MTQVSTHVRAVWMEKGQEFERTVPSNWVRGKKLCWPSKLQVRKAFQNKADPEDDWKEFDLIKIKVSGKMMIIFIPFSLLTGF